jgi:glycosyltransferase involved in cell wall biosynthesis
LRIGIDYTAAAKQRAGIGRITRELIKALAAMDRKNEYLLIHAKETRIDESFPPNFSTFTLPLSERMATMLWQRLKLPVPIDLLTGRLDLFHSPDFVLPPLWHSRSLVTIHDLTFLIHPECADPRLARYLRSRVPRAIERASVVLADSECTRKDLVGLLGVPVEKIEVVYGGVSSAFSPVADEDVLSRVRNKYSIDPPFILSVGRLEPRKNLGRLIDAYRLLRQETNLPHRLLLVGEKGWLYDGLFAQVAKLKLEGDVIFLGFVPDEDLPALFSLADVFAFPSLYEGFGLPPLEAMACGTPVIASNTSCLPEVLGEAVLFIDPTDVNALAEALHRVLTDEELRQNMSRQGLARAAQFSWSASAQKLLAVYEKVASSSK